MLVLPAKYEDMFCETTEYVASFSTLKLIHIQSVKIKKTKKKKLLLENSNALLSTTD